MSGFPKMVYSDVPRRGATKVSIRELWCKVAESDAELQALLKDSYRLTVDAPVKAATEVKKVAKKATKKAK